MPRNAKEGHLRKKYAKRLMRSFQKKTMQTGGSVFSVKIEPVEKTKNELDLIKSVDCFPDDFGSYRGKLVTFEIIHFKLTFFCIPKINKNVKW